MAIFFSESLQGFFNINDIGTCTVDAYDNSSDRSYKMPRMHVPRSYQLSVAIENIHYIMGGQTNKCEVYDRCSANFVLIKSTLSFFI